MYIFILNCLLCIPLKSQVAKSITDTHSTYILLTSNQLCICTLALFNMEQIITGTNVILYVYLKIHSLFYNIKVDSNAHWGRVSLINF